MRFRRECPLNRRNLPSGKPALPVEILLLGDLPGVPPRAHRRPRPDRRVELLGAGRRGVHDDPRDARVRLGPRAEALLEPEQDLERVAGRLDPVVGERVGSDPERPREGLQLLRPGRPEPELVVAYRGLGHARHLGELALQEAVPRPELAYPAAVRHVSPVFLIYLVHLLISG